MTTVQTEDAADADIVVPFDSVRRKRAFAAQKAQHLIPAAGLLYATICTSPAGSGFLAR